MLGGFGIAQSGERNPTQSGISFGRVDSEPVETARLFRHDIREQLRRLSQFARFDGFLRISLQRDYSRTVAGLSRRRCSEFLEALCDFDKLGSQPLRRNVLFPNRL